MTAVRPSPSDKGPGGIQQVSCAMCVKLKESQSDFVERLSKHLPQSLCNQHTWLIAKSGEAGPAGDVFVRLLGSALKEEPQVLKCALCTRLTEEEDEKAGELVVELEAQQDAQQRIADWGLCLPHARKLWSRLDVKLQGQLLTNLKERATQLRRELLVLTHDAGAGLPRNPGVLGRAAEFLAAKRGLDAGRP